MKNIPLIEKIRGIKNILFYYFLFHSFSHFKIPIIRLYYISRFNDVTYSSISVTSPFSVLALNALGQSDSAKIIMM